MPSGKILKGELGGERREVWWQVRRNGLGLVDRTLSALSEVGEEEAREVRSFLYLLCFFPSFVALHVGSQGQEPYSCRIATIFAMSSALFFLALLPPFRLPDIGFYLSTVLFS